MSSQINKYNKHSSTSKKATHFKIQSTDSLDIKLLSNSSSDLTMSKQTPQMLNEKQLNLAIEDITIAQPFHTT